MIKTVRQYTAAVLQFEPSLGAKSRNVDEIERLIRDAAVAGARLVVTPEMATTGLIFESPSHVAPYVESIPGPTTERLRRVAAEFGCLVVVGLPEVDPTTGMFYNAAALVGPSGLLGRHRKVHCYPSDPLWAAEGDLGFQVWQTPFGRLGMMICMDANYPESARLLALAGAEVFILPAAWGPDGCPSPIWLSRAFENGRPLVCANREGWEGDYQMTGGSCFIEADGSVQASAAPGTTIAFGEIDLDASDHASSAVGRRDPLAVRRPELYATLGLHRFLFGRDDTSTALGGQPRPVRRSIRIGVCERQSTAPIASWIEWLDAWVRGLEHQAPDLVVLPSPAFQEPPLDHDGAIGSAQTVPGPITRALGGWAEETGRYLAAGLLEADGADLFDTVVLVGPGGLLARIRSAHPPAEQPWFARGNDVAYVDTTIGRIGLLTGSDLLLPEPARCLALEGVDVVCVCANLDGPGLGPDGWNIARVRATENDVIVAFANRGRLPSAIHSVGPFGTTLLETVVKPDPASDEATATLRIDRTSGTVDRILRDKPALNRRRPVLYGPLLRSGPASPDPKVSGGRSETPTERQRPPDGIGRS